MSRASAGPLLSVSRRWEPAATAALLAGFALLLYAPLLFTNRVVSGGDIFTYFYPYRDYASSVLREGRVPLWNPYIFLGAPFLANPQAAVLYPLHWPFLLLPTTKQIYWSAALHTWLLSFGGALLLRRWGGSFPANLAVGLVLAGSGFWGGLVGHMNQMNAAAWLPWGVLVLEGIGPTGGRRPPPLRRLLRSLLLFSLLVVLVLLAGHTQMLYINLCGLGVWAACPAVAAGSGRWVGRWWTAVWPRLLIYTLGATWGLLLGAAQVLPTLELSGLGLRGSGLSYGEASSFSLQPLHLGWTLLPSYGLADLSVVFATPAYSEFIAYVGLIGLALGGWGAVRGAGRGRVFGLVFALLGLFLAFGRWNPIYYVLYQVVPGFDLFRTPARWMMLYTLGMAVLAGVGVDALRMKRSVPVGTPTDAGGPRPRLAPLILLILAVDLLLAARGLPHAHPTAPQAVYDLRTAPAHLLSDPSRQTLDPAAAGRFLSMSTASFEPGDKPDYRRILLEGDPPQLSARAFDALVYALKDQEILAPNLSLFWRVPAVDGYDGGVLPLRRFLDFLTLLIPPDALVPDGRLREQVKTVPPARLLGLLNAQYVITDKLTDLWVDDVYYDRQIGAQIGAVRPEVRMAASGSFEATHIDIVGAVNGGRAALAQIEAEKRAVADLQVRRAGETIATLTLTAGGQPGAHLADGRLGSRMAAGSGARVVYRDEAGGRQEMLARLPLAQPVAPDEIVLVAADAPVTTTVTAITLYDARTGMFEALLPSDRGRFRLVHSGDVKIYENLDLLPRARLIHEWLGAEDAPAALALLRRDDLDFSRQAVVEGLPTRLQTAPSAAGEAAVVNYAAERVEIRTRSSEPGLLVLSDSYYPGWRATVDGIEATIYPANYLFRGVPVRAGEHTVVFEYRPQPWRWGLIISGVSAALWLGIAAWERSKVPARPQSSSASLQPPSAV